MCYLNPVEVAAASDFRDVMEVLAQVLAQLFELNLADCFAAKVEGTELGGCELVDSRLTEVAKVRELPQEDFDLLVVFPTNVGVAILVLDERMEAVDDRVDLRAKDSEPGFGGELLEIGDGERLVERAPNVFGGSGAARGTGDWFGGDGVGLRDLVEILKLPAVEVRVVGDLLGESGQD